MEDQLEKTGTFILPDKLRDPSNFEEVIENRDSILDSVKTLDLRRIAFIEPYSMLSLLLLGRHYLRNRSEKLRLVNIPINIHQYLHRMDFVKTGIFDIDEKLHEELLLKRSSFSNRVVEITEIPNKERESIRIIRKVITIFRKRASHILKYWLSDSIIDYFITVISELCQNIFEHSLDSGYLAMQTYTLGKENIVRLVISDSGIGIRRSFEHCSNVKYNSTAELIELSLTTPISSKREFGYGLCQVNSIVKMLKGMIFIRSENAYITSGYHTKAARSSIVFQKNDLKSFDGTQISISLSG